jgi:DNA polymerase-3 subunit delta'
MSFRDFSPQPSLELLQRSLAGGRLGHAYMFQGGNLNDLEAVARTLVKTLSCQDPPRRGSSGLGLDSCDQCSSCRRIEADNYPDALWLRPESKSRVLTIDQIRELLQSIYLKPMEAGFKTAVIVAADRLNAQAANAFLKTLEEPPPKSILILLTTEPQRILETIISRCLRLNFGGDTRKLEPNQSAWLSAFAEMAATRSTAGLLGRYQLLDVLLKKLADYKTEIEKNISARSPLEKYDDIDPKLREKWEDELSAAIEAEYRRQRADLLLLVEWWLRDVWLQARRLNQQLTRFPDLAGATEKVARRISPEAAQENLRVLERTQRLLGSNVQEALTLEVGVLQLSL